MPNDATYGENDTGPVAVTATTSFDRNRYYGRVVYAHGPAETGERDSRRTWKELL